MPTNDEIIAVVNKSIDLARQMGFREGEMAVQGRVMKAMNDYADLAEGPLLTAADAFRIILHSLIEEGDNDV